MEQNFLRLYKLRAFGIAIPEEMSEIIDDIVQFLSDVEYEIVYMAPDAANYFYAKDKKGIIRYFNREHLGIKKFYFCYGIIPILDKLEKLGLNPYFQKTDGLNDHIMDYGAYIPFIEFLKYLKAPSDITDFTIAHGRILFDYDAEYQNCLGYI